MDYFDAAYTQDINQQHWVGWGMLQEQSRHTSDVGNFSAFISVDFHQKMAEYTRRFFYLPIYPEKTTSNISTSYATADIIGRPGQISAYNNTSDETINFSLHLHRELQTYGNDIVDINHVDAIIALMKAAQYPKFIPAGTYAPIVTYCFGDSLFIGKQNSVSTEWTGPKIHGAFMECNVNINMTCVPDGILTFDIVRNSVPRGIGRFSNYMGDFITDEAGPSLYQEDAAQNISGLYSGDSYSSRLATATATLSTVGTTIDEEIAENTEPEIPDSLKIYSNNTSFHK